MAYSLGFTTDEFSVSFVANTADSSSTFLEVGPTLIVCLGLVKIDGFLVLVDLVKPKFGFFALVSQNIYIVNGRFVQFTVIRSVAR